MSKTTKTSSEQIVTDARIIAVAKAALGARRLDDGHGWISNEMLAYDIATKAGDNGESIFPAMTDRARSAWAGRVARVLRASDLFESRKMGSYAAAPIAFRINW